MKKMNDRAGLRLVLVGVIAVGLAVTGPDSSAARGGKGKGNGGNNNVGGDYTATEGVVFITPSDVRPSEFVYHIVGTVNRDTIFGGSFNDLIDGGEDTDTISGLGGDDEIHGEFVDGGEGDDVLYGGFLSGGPGTDELYGDDGNGILFFSVGADDGFGGYEADIFDGGNGLHDQLNFTGDEYGIPISVSVDLRLGTYQATVSDASGNPVQVVGTFTNIEQIWGTPGNDFIEGTDYADSHLDGHDGDDTINGNDGDDELNGGRGNDIVSGGAGNDNLSSDGGENIFDGGEGNDHIEGRSAANEQMTGGSGCDEFTFFRQIGVDTILDFEPLCDWIDLTHYNRYSLDYNDLNIDQVGGDVWISFWKNKQGGAGGTIILQNTAISDINSSDFRF